jgi:hypothetical protein
MNKRGQALVEFVLILPIFLLLLFVIFDFGKIFNAKNVIESDSTDIVLLYKSGKTIDEIKGLYPNNIVELSTKDGYDEIKVASEVKITTPGLNRVFGKKYKIEVVRYIPNEQ